MRNFSKIEFYSKILSFFGWFLIVLGGINMYFRILDFLKRVMTDMHLETSINLLTVYTIGILSTFTTGILFIIIAQFVKLFMSIEQNAFETKEVLSELLEIKKKENNN